MSYAGSLKKKNENPSKKNTQPSRQPVSNERSSSEILSTLRSSRDGGSRSGRPNTPGFKNEGPNKLVKPIGAGSSLVRNFPTELRRVFVNESAEDKRKRLREVILRHESPFQRNSWESASLRLQTSISKLEEKIKEVKEERVGIFKWRNFCLNLTLSYEHFRAGNLESSLKIIERLESHILTSAGCDGKRDYFFLGIYDALYHVVIASKVYLLLEMDKLTEAEKLLPQITPFGRIRRSGRAGMFGLRAAVLMEYGREGNLRALEEINRALEHDESTAEWFFLKGKCMARIRRIVGWNELVHKDEMTALNLAVEKDKKNAVYRIYLAQSLRDKAFRELKNLPESTKFEIVYKRRRLRRKQINENTEEGKRIYKIYWAAYYTMMEAVEKSPDNVRILIRAAWIMVKLPFRMANLKLATEWLDKAMEKAPNNSLAHHVKGMLLERFDVEPEKALEELRIAAELGNYGAAMSGVRMSFRLQQQNIVEQLDQLATVFTDSVQLQNTYTEAGSYLLFIKRDLAAAAKYFSKVIDLDVECYQMKNHKSMFLRMERPVDLIVVLKSDLKENVQWDSFSKEDQTILRALSLKMFSVPQSESDVGKTLFSTDVIEKSRQLMEKDRRVRSRPPKTKFVFRGKPKRDKKKKKGLEIDLEDSKLTPDGKSMADKFTIQNQLSSSPNPLQRYPSNSSLSSVSSIGSDVSHKPKYHDSRSSGLTKENVQELESQFINLPRRPRGMFEFDRASCSDDTASSDNGSVFSLDSGMSMMDLRRASASSGRSSAEVMNRVRQSYSMLDYKKTDDGQTQQPSRSSKKQSKLNRTDSTQSLHTEKQRQEPSRLQRRTDSVQSLDSIEKFRPTFAPSSSNRSATFMPKFGQK